MNYPTIKRELMAIVKLQRFMTLCVQHPILIRTDHMPLLKLDRIKTVDSTTIGWLTYVKSFNPKVIHRKGSEHGNADALSRLCAAPLPEENEEDEFISAKLKEARRKRLRMLKEPANIEVNKTAQVLVLGEDEQTQSNERGEADEEYTPGTPSLRAHKDS